MGSFPSTMKAEEWLAGSAFRGELAKGCTLCAEGRKMVLLVTGRCWCGCYYCPLSERKKGKDLAYADEKLVGSDGDILAEAESIDALGSSLTGGDPLLALDTTLSYIRLLKERFGKQHHVHLYTATAARREVLERLAEAGLDEMRFHPPPEAWAELPREWRRTLKDALGTGMAVGVEVPAIPGTEGDLVELAAALEGLNVQFLNLNELEFSETNWRALKERGLEILDDVSSAVKGSRETALAVVEDESIAMPVHYCSSSFKDAVQLRNRLMRRAKNTARPYDIITDEGTFIRGVVEAPDTEAVAARLREEYDIPEELIAVDEEKARVELAAWIVEELAVELEWPAFIVEEYPTADRLEVERTPLN